MITTLPGSHKPPTPRNGDDVWVVLLEWRLQVADAPPEPRVYHGTIVHADCIRRGYRTDVYYQLGSDEAAVQFYRDSRYHRRIHNDEAAARREQQFLRVLLTTRLLEQSGDNDYWCFALRVMTLVSLEQKARSRA